MCFVSFNVLLCCVCLFACFLLICLCVGVFDCVCVCVCVLVSLLHDRLFGCPPVRSSSAVPIYVVWMRVCLSVCQLSCCALVCDAVTDFVSVRFVLLCFLCLRCVRMCSFFVWAQARVIVPVCLCPRVLVS